MELMKREGRCQPATVVDAAVDAIDYTNGCSQARTTYEDFQNHEAWSFIIICKGANVVNSGVHAKP